MKVHFDGCNPHVRTGPNTFALRLARKLFELGHEVTFDLQGAIVSLVFIEPSGAWLAPTIVQRLDGIWSKPDEFEVGNRNIKGLYERAAAVVWQSRFDRSMTVKHWGMPGSRRDHGCILPEPVDRVIGNGTFLTRIKELSIPKLIELRGTYERVYVCSSNWHPQKRLEANVRLFERLRLKHPNSCLIIMGDHPDHRATGSNVFYAGSVAPEVYAQIYSAADWMLHLAWADHCPNVVVEALAQGTPVACSEIGGTRELVGGYGVVLKEATYDYALCNYDDPPMIDVTQVDDLPTRQELDYTSIADIDIKNVARRYVELFEQLIRGNT